MSSLFCDIADTDMFSLRSFNIEMIEGLLAQTWTYLAVRPDTSPRFIGGARCYTAFSKQPFLGHER